MIQTVKVNSSDIFIGLYIRGERFMARKFYVLAGEEKFYGGCSHGTVNFGQ